MAFLVKHPQSRYWVAGFYDATGKRRRRSTKVEATEKNRRKAMKIAEEYEAAAKNLRTARQVRKVITELHQELTGTDMPSATVREYSVLWLERKRNEVKPSTLAFYRAKTNSFLEFLGERADREISEVTNTDIVSFRDDLAEKVVAKTTNHTVKAIRSFFGDAKLEGYIFENPCDGVKSVRTKVSEITEVRPFTIEELRAVLSVADEEWRSMILFGVYTMLRMADIAKLTSASIDWKQEVIRVHISKTEKPQVIPLAKPLLKHLQSIDRLKSSEEEPVHVRSYEAVMKNGRTQTLSRQFVSIMAKAGLRKPVSSRNTGKGRDKKRNRNSLNFHSLRHTGNSLLANAGVSRELRKSITGHTSDSIHDGYTHIEVGAQRNVLDELPDLTDLL